MLEPSLTGRIAIVTGATTGIGKQIALGRFRTPAPIADLEYRLDDMIARGRVRAA